MKKVSWGWGIIISLAIFMTGTAAWVAYAVSSEVDLVRSDYYEYSLRQNETTAAQKDARELGNSVKLALDAKRNIEFKLPVDQVSTAQGTIKLYRPNSSASDRALDLKLSTDGSMSIPTSELAKGIWHITVDWSAAGKKYEVLKTITL